MAKAKSSKIAFESQASDYSQYDDIISENSGGEEAERGRLDTFLSVTSIYSADGGKGCYAVTGKVQLGVSFKNGVLSTRVVRATGLVATKSRGVSDPYIKTYLLPDKSKHTKRKTGIQRKTTNPEYNEVFKNKLSAENIGLTTLWLSVWDWDKFGKNQFLGEIRLPLSSLDLTNFKEKWYPLREKAHIKGTDNDYRGKIKVAIKFAPHPKSANLPVNQQKGSFLVSVKEASDLPCMDPQGSGSTDATVRLFLLPKRGNYSKKKTKIVHNSLNPVWDENFDYKYTPFEDLTTNRVLELTVWDYDRRGCNDFIGCIRLGPDPDNEVNKMKDWMDSTDEEMSHWQEMLDNPGEWVEKWHDLRSLVSRKYEEFIPPPQESPSALQQAQGSSFSTDDGASCATDEESPSGSVTSIYSESCEKGDYDITGELRVGLQYKGEQLHVAIDRAQGLAAADSNGYSDPYVKCYLLPDRSKYSKRRTEIKKKTLNPEFRETFIYDVEKSKLSTHTLLFSVFDWDRFGKNEFLGEVRIPLANVDLTYMDYRLYTLKDTNAAASSPLNPFTRGELKLGLMYEQVQSKKGKVKEMLHISVQCARGLPNMDRHSLTDAFVQLYLLPDKSASGKHRTHVVDDNLDPVWNRKFTYKKVNFEDLTKNRVLEISVWDRDMMSNEFIGCLRLGPESSGDIKASRPWMDSSKSETSHWEEMLAHPGLWVEHWHPLRPSMKPVMRSNLSSSFPDLHKISDVQKVEVARERFKNFDFDRRSTSSLPRLPRGSALMTKKPTFLKKIHQKKSSLTTQQYSAPTSLSTTQPSSSPSVGATEPSSNSPVTEEELAPVTSHSDTGSNALNSNGLKTADSHGEGISYVHSRHQDILSSNDFSSSVEITYEEGSEKFITGKVLFGAHLEDGLLYLHIDKAQGLAKQSSGQSPNPCVEIYVLSGQKKSKYKTDVKTGTCDPVYDLTFKHKISQQEINLQTLWLKVWDRNSANKKFLGEIKLPLSDLNWSVPGDKWYPLGEKAQGISDCKLKISMKFEVITHTPRGKRGTLHVLIQEAQNVCSSGNGGESTVKCHLLPEKIMTRKRTSTISEKWTPACKSTFIFEKLALDELVSERVLEVTLWDSRFRVGGLRLGSPKNTAGSRKKWMDCTGEEVRHWESALVDRPGEWVEAWHSLRTTLE